MRTPPVDRPSDQVSGRSTNQEAENGDDRRLLSPVPSCAAIHAENENAQKGASDGYKIFRENPIITQMIFAYLHLYVALYVPVVHEGGALRRK